MPVIQIQTCGELDRKLSDLARVTKVSKADAIVQLLEKYVSQAIQEGEK